MKILAFFVALFAFQSIAAQDYTFRVLINKGQNAVKSGNDWVPVKVGASLGSSDELKISANGYMGLVHRSGKPLEVKETGQYSVADLAAKIKEGSSVLNKYTDFILSSKAEKTTNLTATGAVHRGTGEIRVYLPKAQQAIVFNNLVTLAWAKHPGSSRYIVEFNSMFGDQLHQFEVKDTTVTIDLGSKAFNREDNIVLKVSSGDNPRVVSQDFILKRLSAADKKRISVSLKPVEQLIQEKSAINLLYLASFYEENALLIDASSALQEAMKLAPQVPAYSEAFNGLVMRHGLRN